MLFGYDFAYFFNNWLISGNPKMAEVWRLVVSVVLITFFFLWFGLPWILCPIAIVLLIAFVVYGRRNFHWFLVKAFLRDIRYLHSSYNAF